MAGGNGLPLSSSSLNFGCCSMDGAFVKDKKRVQDKLLRYFLTVGEKLIPYQLERVIVDALIEDQLA